MLLDGTRRREGHDFFSLGALTVDPDGHRLAYAVDTEGDERFALRVKDLRTGDVLDDAVTRSATACVWSLDGRYVFYTRVDDSWRPHQVWRHEVGTPRPRRRAGPPGGRRALLDRRRLLPRRPLPGHRASGSKTDHRGAAARRRRPRLATPRVVAPRREGVEYDVEPAGDRLLITAQRRQPRLRPRPGAAGRDRPGPVAARSSRRGRGSASVDVEAFAGHVVVSLRQDGLTALRVLPRDSGRRPGFGAPPTTSTFDEPLYSVGHGQQPRVATPRRCRWSSSRW